VFTVSRLGRLEDVDDARALGRKPSAFLRIAAGLLVAAPFAVELAQPAPWAGRTPHWFGVVVLAGLAVGGPRAAARRTTWTRADVMRAMGMCLRRLLVFTALVALAVGGRDAWIVAGAILAGYPLSYALRGVFPPS
jgi:hypothetical protein